jgi:4-amino-4-deoxy-L-arabinose transferase-like glycosyltransferase
MGETPESKELIRQSALNGRKPWFVRWGGLLAAFGLALAFRLPWLWEVPRHIDELKEVFVAYRIYLGDFYPLHNAARDIGALHNYILAAIFRLLGPDIYWPRLYVALTSALTVALVYLLGKKLYGRMAGLIAAGLLLTNGMHILVTHMAWANCTTPFFFTLAFLATAIALERGGGWRLTGVGILWGLTLQTHASVIIYIAALFLYLWRRSGQSGRDLIRTGLGVAIGYANMIAYNLVSLGGSFRWIHTKGYTLEPHPGLLSFGKNWAAMFTELLRAISSIYSEQAGFWEYLFHPGFVLAAGLLGIGIYHAVRTRRDLPVWMLAIGFLVIPWINRRYGFYVSTRYIMPLVINGLLLIGLGLREVAGFCRRLVPGLNRAAIPLALVFGVVVLLQIVPFYNYCARVSDTNLSNRLPLAIIRSTMRSAGSRPLILVDRRMRIENDPLPILFTISQMDHRVVDFTAMEEIQWGQAFVGDSGQRLLAVLDEKTLDRMAEKEFFFVIRSFKTRVALHSKLAGRRWNTVYLAEIKSPRRHHDFAVKPDLH